MNWLLLNGYAQHLPVHPLEPATAGKYCVPATSLVGAPRCKLLVMQECTIRHTDCLPLPGEENMLHYALLFLLIAVVAAVLGFGGVAGAAAGIAKVFAVVFLVIFLASLFMGRRRVV